MFFIESEEECICPECKSGLKYRDKVLRIQRYRDSEPKWFAINRLKCTNESCGRIHRQLPDEMVKFKHYSAEDIRNIEAHALDLCKTILFHCFKIKYLKPSERFLIYG